VKKTAIRRPWSVSSWILLVATLVRALLLPALVSLLGG